jgi:hypothetical protein
MTSGNSDFTRSGSASKLPTVSAPDLLETLALSPDEKAALIAEARCFADFMICRNRIRISGNTPLPVEKYLRFYGPFRVASEGSKPADLAIYCRCSADASGGEVVLLMGAEACRVRDPDVIENLDTALDYLILPKIKSHYLVHAGCVSRDGQGIILSGSSGMGKTTLTAHLVSRGMGYLTDETAPIHRATCTVDPFPLRLGIRPGPAGQLAEEAPAVDFEFGEDRKRLVDVRDLGASLVTEPVPLHSIVFLAQRATAEVATPRRFSGAVRVSFLGATPEFRNDLLDQTKATFIREERISPKITSWRLEVRNSDSFVPTLQDVAGKHGVLVAGVEYEDIAHRDFSASPKLIKLPQSAGVIELVKKIPSSQKKEIMRSDFSGKMPLLVQEITRLTERVAFYKLSPGRLDEMIAAIEGLP